MSDLLSAFEITFPIVLIAVIGWLARLYMKFPENAELVLTRYVVYLAAPASLILSIADSKLEEILQPRLFLATILAYAVAFVGIVLIHRYLLRRSLGDSAFAGFTVAKFNLIIIGLPLVISAVGTQGTPALVINGFVSYLFLTPFVLFLHGISGDGSENAASPVEAILHGAKETITNPLIIASLVGLALLLLGISVPHLLQSPLDSIGKSVVPAGLIAVGLSIRQIKPANWGLEIWLMSMAKVLVVPVVAICIALLIDLDPHSATSLVLLFSVPTAVVAYALSQEVKAYAHESGEIVVLTTILGAITIPLTLLLCKLIWGV